MKPSSGQILIEVIVAALVIIMVSLAISELINTSIKSTETAMAQASATFLSGESVDAVRAVAREDWHAISNLSTTTSNTYYPVVAGGKWTITAGSQSVVLNGITYARSFTLSDIYRSTSTGNIVSAGGYYDPSTVKVTSNIAWTDNFNHNLSFSQVQYISRYLNQIYSQTDWSGGFVGETVTTGATTSFATSTSLDTTSTPGSVQLSTQ